MLCSQVLNLKLNNSNEKLFQEKNVMVTQDPTDKLTNLI